VKLVESSPTEVLVEDAKGRLPTVPSWNANKMPLASGMARAVAALRTEIDDRLHARGEDPDLVADWLVEEWSISNTNAAAVIDHFTTQALLSKIPTERRFLIERYLPDDEENADGERVCFFFHSLIGRSANDALSRILVKRLKDAVGGNALVTLDDYGFLLTLRRFQDLGVAEWRELFSAEGAGEILHTALVDSQLVKWQFSGIAQTGLMIPRNVAGGERTVRQIRWSADLLYQVLAKHEPDHPLLEQAVHEAKHTFLDLDRAVSFLHEAHAMEWELVEVPAVSPFAFGLYASKIRESLMMESPEEAIERLYREMQRKVAGRYNGTD
jgi:ATP-dependent Lhr-like helicase